MASPVRFDLPSARTIEFRLHDLDIVMETMRSMAPKLRNKGLRTAVRRGAMVVRRAARANARRIDDPETASVIWKAIALQYARRESRRQKAAIYRVGVRGGARATKGTANDPRATFHWRFLELGTSEIAANPFMRSALANNRTAATQEIITTLNREIAKLAAEWQRPTSRGRGAG